jgi:hypothetical protein
MKKRNKYPYLAFLGLAIWLAENFYFGWNAKPESGLESGLDLLSQVLIIWGIVGDLLRNVRITKTYHNITNAKKLTILDQRPNGKTVRNYSVKTEEKSS